MYWEIGDMIYFPSYFSIISWGIMSSTSPLRESIFVVSLTSFIYSSMRKGISTSWQQIHKKPFIFPLGIFNVFVYGMATCVLFPWHAGFQAVDLNCASILYTMGRPKLDLSLLCPTLPHSLHLSLSVLNWLVKPETWAPSIYSKDSELYIIVQTFLNLYW